MTAGHGRMGYERGGSMGTDGPIIRWEEDFDRGGDGPDLPACLGPANVAGIEAALVGVPAGNERVTLEVTRWPGQGFYRARREGGGWYVDTDYSADDFKRRNGYRALDLCVVEVR
jgi:hypothetical protein